MKFGTPLSPISPGPAQAPSGAVPRGWVRQRSIALRKLALSPFWGWTFAAIALAVLLRAPWFGAPLGNDEGGLTYIAAHWHLGGPDLYGHYFIDRPPLLLAVFKIASVTGGTAAVRTIGAFAAALLVFVVAVLGREVGGARAGVWSGAIAAVLGSSVLLGSVLTPAELLAVLPSAGSVLVVLLAHRSARRKHLLLALGGLLAAAAMLVKQSFGDALVAGTVFLIVSAYLDRGNRRRWVGLSAAYAAGLGIAIVGLDIWEGIDGVPDGAASYALFGFRLDGLSALAGSAGGLPGRLAERLALPFLGSGMALVLIWSVVGIGRLKARPQVQLTLAAWGIAGAAGVLLGGSYWPHYLIELIPAASVTAGVALAAGKKVAVRATGAALLTAAVLGATVGPPWGDSPIPDERARDIGQAIARRAHPGDTIYVRYSQPNITYYSGLRNPFRYDWSLMLQTIPGAQHELRAMLRSPRRPTWIVKWEASDAYGLDASAATARLIRKHYGPAGRVDGIGLLLERGVERIP